MASSLDELDVKVYIDYPQYRRNVKAPFVYAVDGTSFDTSTAVNCYIEPVTRTAMGMPVPMTPQWKTTFTGQGYTRFVKSDFTFTSPTSWGNIFFYGTDDTYLYCTSNVLGITSAPVQLNGGVKRNQPLFFSFIKQEKKSSNTNITAKLFWGGTNFNNTDTQLHFKDDGSCDVYRGYILKSGTILCTTSTAVVTGSLTLFTSEIPGASVLYTDDGRTIGTVSTITNNTTLTLTATPTFNYAGQFHIKEPLKVASYSRNENNYNQQAVKITHSNPSNDYNDVFIMPMRGKELVVNTSFGLNFSHTFADLMDPNEPAKNVGYYGGLSFSNGALSESTPAQLFMLPEILPAGDFSIVIPNGKAAFQLAKLYFLTNWSIKSNIINNEIAQQGLKNMGYKAVGPQTGTIVTSTNSNVVLGNGTSFDASFLNGRLFSVNQPSGISINEIGTVSTVTSSTVLGLSSLAGGIFTFQPFTILKKPSGTITASTSSNIITGVGTLFNTQISLFDDIYDANDNYLGKVQSISSNTSLTLQYNSMTDVSAGSYWLNIPMVLDVFNNTQSELMGPATSTQYTDFLTSTSMVPLFNNTSTDAIYNSTYAKLSVIQQSATDPSNSLKNNDSTTIFYSGDFLISYKPVKTKTSLVDITSVLESLSIERKETGEMGCVFSARKQNLIDLGLSNPDILSNRPIKITIKPRDTSYSEKTIFDGYLRNPEIEYIRGTNYDKYSLLTFEGYCKKQSLNDVYFTKAPSFDSIDYFEAMKSLLMYGGIVEPYYNMSFDLQLQGYDLGINRNNSNGQYNWTANLSDSVGSFIEKIRSELSQNIAFGTNKIWHFDSIRNNFYEYDGYYFSDTSSKGNVLGFSMPLYLSESSANTYGSIPLHKAYKRTIRNLKKTYEAPEANQVILIGVDKTNNERITSVIDDVNSQNPTITNRPNNWLGNVKSATIINDRLNSQNQVSKSANLLFNKISTGREMIEFQSDFLTYFDDFTKQPSSLPPLLKTGFITTSTSSNVVTGLGTFFTTELVVGSFLYNTSGVFIGSVASITNNTTLTLTLNANVNLSNGYYLIGLNGTIDTFTYSNVVNGTGTGFLTQLAPGNFLYSPDGYLIGQIASIASNTSLTLTSNALYAVSSSLYYTNNPYKWLYQYENLDTSINNVVELKNLDGTSNGYYKIMSWKADFVKNNIPVYVSGVLQKPDTINVAQCTYRAMKVSFDNKAPIVERDFTNRYFENTINVLKSTLSKVMLVVTSPGTTSVSLSGAPSGMTFYVTDMGQSKVIIIQWTPSAAQIKNVYNVSVNITNTAFTTNTYSIPLTFKVFDTL